MTNFVGIDISGNKEIAKKINGLYPQAAAAGTESANEYIVDSIRIYPPYSYVPLSKVGGFVSDRQRRYVMAMIAQGNITPGQSNRTQRLAQGWQTVGSGVNQIVVNEVDYAPYLHEITGQTQMHMLQGWQVLPEFIANRMDAIIRKFDAGVKKAIRRLGLG